MRRILPRRTLLAALLFWAAATTLARAQDTTFTRPNFPGMFGPTFNQSVQTIATGFIAGIDSSNAPYFGFSMPIMPYTLGNLIPIAVVGLNDSTEADFRKAAGKVVFAQVPVLQQNKVGSSIELAPGPHGLRFGYASVTRHVETMIDSLTYYTPMTRGSLFLVRVPAYNLLFLARIGVDTKSLYLTPVFNYPSFGLQRGVEMKLHDMWPMHLAPNFGSRSVKGIR